MDSQILSQRAADLAADRKALDVRCIDVRGRCGYTDFLIVASGTSDRHVKAIAEGVEGDLRAERVRCLGHEGLREGQWALIDFGDVMLHVFHHEIRPLYDLEDLWRDAPARAVVAPPSVGHYPPDAVVAAEAAAACSTESST